MSRLVLIGYTPRSWSGGVNRWTNDFIAGFPEAVHYSWWDLLASGVRGDNPDISEWDRARVLNQWLIWSKKISRDDIIVVDGFWGLGLEQFPNVISVCHGIWSHLTKEDADAGKQPDFPLHHREQVRYRQRHVDRGGRMVSVSDFIAGQLNAQWGWSVPVIDTGIDLDRYKPGLKSDRRKPLIIHGVNDRGNENKGWSHVELLKRELDAWVMSLDEAYSEAENVGEKLSKEEVLAQADLVVIPSGYEGNSLFCLETLSCDVPIVAYNVGLPYRAWTRGEGKQLGLVMDRSVRSPQHTLECTRQMLEMLQGDFLDNILTPRTWVSQFSLQSFHQKWREYLKTELDYDSPQG